MKKLLASSIQKRKHVLLIIFLFYLNPIYSQSLTVEGEIKDSNGDALPGASVLIKGTTVGTITDIDGKFNLTANSDDVLSISFVGFLSEEIAVSGRSYIEVLLIPDISELQEVVVIGYGTAKRSDLTGAIAVVDTEELTKFPVSDVTQAMQGRISGVQVNSSSVPGGGSKINIRGVATITGNTEPLYVVDGVQMNSIANINPSDIESMNVLKDASAAAIYGNRAANGVVIITTKKGAEGKVTFDFDTEYGTQVPTQLYDVMNTRQFADYSVDYHQLVDPPTIRLNLWAVNDSILQTDTDWVDEAFSPAPILRMNFAGSGGSENGNYRISTGYFKQEGTLRSTGYDRFNVNLNSNVTRGILTIGAAYNLYYSDREMATSEPNVMRTAPQIPLYDPSQLNGYGIPTKENSGTVNTRNRILELDLIDKTQRLFGVNGNFYAQLKILDGLTFRTSANTQVTYEVVDTKNPAIDQGTAITATRQATFEKYNMQWSSLQSENYFNYDKYFGVHHVSAMLGYTVMKEEIEANSTIASGIPDGLETLENAQNTNVSYDISQRNLQSFLGRASYDFNDKYFVTASVRIDETSNFSKDNRVGTFPSFSLGWRLSNENFLSNVDWLADLKLRGGYGELGRQTPLGEDFRAEMWPNMRYPFPGGTSLQGAVPDSYPAEDLKWETAKQTNIGLDFSVLGYKLTFTTDYFIKDGENMLLNVELPRNLGLGGPGAVFPGNGWRNIGSMKNEGVEFSLLYRKKEGNFNFSLGGNITYVTNEVTQVNRIGDDAVPIFANEVQRITEGESMWHFYGYRTDGLFQSQDEIDNYGQVVNGEFKQYQPWAKPGDVKFVDTNQDGVFDNTDREVIGNSLPDLFYGISFSATYKGFDLSLLLEGKSGYKVYNQNYDILTRTSDKTNRHVDLIDNTWTEENKNAAFPVIAANSLSYQFSDRMLQDGNYLSVKNVQLGYDFSKRFDLQKAGISRMRIYLNAINLAMFTNYNGYNPDVWDDRDQAGRSINRSSVSNGAGIEFVSRALPLPRTFTGGIQITF